VPRFASICDEGKEERNMRQRLRALGRMIPTANLLGCMLALALAAPAAANEVIQWNETTMNAIEANGQNAVVSTRTLAMVHAAVHDALNAVSRRYDAYYFEGPGDAAASPDAAIAAAAHTVLVGVVGSFGTPAQKGATLALLDQAYAASLARVTDGPARNKGVAVGRAAGAAMLMLRKDDGATRDAPYTPGVGPGRWRPHPNTLPPNPPIANPDMARGYAASILPGWGNVAPFTLLSASQFWLPGPPALTSATYARDFNEVKSVGGRVSTVRTAEQTEIARFWFEGPGAWNRISRTMATTRGLDARDSARLLALVNFAMADAYIAGFKIRYVYDLWRPVTAIREGDNDGNDATAGDPTWDSHQNTPAVSDYPSTQSTFSGAASVVLASVLGGDQASFSVTSGKPFEGLTRSFTSFAQAARESADSRVFAGIHFRSACEDGLTLGRKIGQRTATMYLLPARK
jgi:PAP2 superfamily